jgi:hypothetical protein
MMLVTLHTALHIYRKPTAQLQHTFSETVDVSSVSQPFLHGGTTKIIFLILRNPMYGNSYGPQKVNSGNTAQFLLK